MESATAWEACDVVSLTPQIIELRDSKGFRAATADNLPIKLLCVVRELDELVEAMRSGDDFSVCMELADCAMYLLSTIEDLNPGWSSRTVGDIFPNRYQDAEVLVQPVRAEVTGGFEKWRQGNVKDAAMHAEIALLNLMRVAKSLGVSLPDAIRTKIRIVYDRPHRNGGKHPDS